MELQRRQPWLLPLLLLLVAALSCPPAEGRFAKHRQASFIDQLEVLELEPQHQAVSDKFESVKEEVSSCDLSRDKSCSQSYLPVCGSDGKTYGFSNERQLMRAQSEEPSLRKMHEGMCIGMESSSFGLDESSLIPEDLAGFL